MSGYFRKPLPSTEEGVRALIVMLQEDHNKYDYNSEYHCFRLATTLLGCMTFSRDFGFKPSRRTKNLWTFSR